MKFILQWIIISNIKMLWVLVYGKRPNFVLILTDDQDSYLNGMEPMRATRTKIGQSGITFENAFTTSPLCCPSRASIMSGLYAHNHHTINNSLSGGCNGIYWRENIEYRTLANILYQNGYDTFFAGKYLNQYKGATVPPGWVHFYGLHGNSRYYNYTLRENSSNISYTDYYLTDLLKDRVLSYLNTRKNITKPFFLMVTPPAPHAPFTPAKRHRDLFANVQAPRTENFNIVSKDKHWLLSNSSLIPRSILVMMDKYFRNRWEALLSVDEMVSALISILHDHNVLENTFIIYTSDNGYHVGQFAQPFDKRQPYETDIKVPLMIRGPNLPKNITVTIPIALIDLAPTMLEWAKIPVPVTMDGNSLQILLTNMQINITTKNLTDRCNLLIQHYGEGNIETYNPHCPGKSNDRLYQCLPEADCHCQDVWNNTYSCIRHYSFNNNILYCEFNDIENFIEAYNLNIDPYQLENIASKMNIKERLLYSIALDNLRKCSGVASCSHINL